MSGLKEKTASFVMGSALLSACFLSAAEPCFAAKTQQRPAAKAAIESLKQQFGDLTAHPLAGSKIRLRVIVEDGLGQKGETSVEVDLPQRDFGNPINPALAGFRRRLAEAYRHDPKAARSKARGVAADLAVLIRKQEKNIRNPSSLDALNSIRRKLAAAQDVKTANQVVDDLWSVMLQLETDNMPAAEKAFLEAEQALSEGARNGAGAEELRQLQDKAAKAADDLLKDMAEKPGLNADEKQALEKIRDLAREMKGTAPENTQRMMQALKEMKQGGADREKIEKALQDMQQAAEMQDVSNLADEQRRLMEETMKLDEKLQEERDRKLREIRKELERSASDMEERVDRRRALEENRQKQDAERGEESGNRQAQEQSRANRRKLDSLKDDLGRLQDQLKNLEEEDKQAAEDKAQDISDALDNMDDELQDMEENDNPDPGKTKDDVERDIENPGNEPDREMDQPEMPEMPENQSAGNNKEESGQEKKSQGGKKGGGKENGKPSGKAPQSKTLNDMKEGRSRASKDLGERQQRLSKELQNKAGKMQGNGRSAESMGDAAGHMDKSAEKLSRGQAGNSIPDQNKAMESMRAAMAELMRPKQGGGGKDQPQDGNQKGPGGMSRAGASDVSGVHKQQDSGAAMLEPDMNAATRIREKIQEKLKNQGLSPKERQYYQDLLNGNRKAASPPRP